MPASERYFKDYTTLILTTQ
jgi:hypothetical protein